MTHPARRFAPATAVIFSSLAVVRAASAETHRVAVVDPDAELARALDIALSPWGAGVAQVRVDRPGATVPLPVDRARQIARDTRADVVMWVSEDAGRYAAWIYDVASDHASVRELIYAPPFDATTAAAVALSVKALLRFTVVAPAPERFGATVEEATWAFGLTASIATHFGTQPQPEERAGPYVSFWPAALGHRWGAVLGISAGLGVQTTVKGVDWVFDGTLSDFAARAAIGARFPLRAWMTFEPSLGATMHFFSLQYLLSYTSRPVQAGSALYQQHFAGGIEPQIAFSLTLLGGFVRLAPWLGATFLTTLHVFLVDTTEVLEAAQITAEGGLRAEFAVP
jgi:hypothetical protein